MIVKVNDVVGSDCVDGLLHVRVGGFVFADPGRHLCFISRLILSEEEWGKSVGGK